MKNTFLIGFYYYLTFAGGMVCGTWLGYVICGEVRRHKESQVIKKLGLMVVRRRKDQ